EGSYEIGLSVKNGATGAVARSSGVLAFTPLVTGATPLITPTRHPLVYIFSAPPCSAGARVRVQFQSSNVATQSTPYTPCLDGFTKSFYIAGVPLGEGYNLRPTMDTGRSSVFGPWTTFTVAGSAMAPPPVTMLSPDSAAPRGVLLQSVFGSPSFA